MIEYNFTDPKYAVILGKTKRDNDDEVDGDLPPWVDSQTIAKIKINVPSKIKESFASQATNKGLEKLQVVVKGTPYEKIIADDITKDSLQLIRNLWYQKRKKSSATMIAATIAGGAIGAGIGFLVIPGFGHWVGAPLGVLLGEAAAATVITAVGAVSGVAASLIGAKFFKKQAKNITKKLFSDEFHYDLDRKVVANFKGKFGLDESVVRLMQGYMVNRMQNLAKDDEKRDWFGFAIELGIEEQDEIMLKSMMIYFSEELDAIEKVYNKKLLENDDQSADALKALRQDFAGLQYILKAASVAKLEGKNTIVLPDEVNAKLAKYLGENNENKSHIDALARSKKRLSREYEQTKAVSTTSQHYELSAKQQSLFKPAPRAITVNTPISIPIIGESLTQFGESISERVRERARQDVTLGVTDIQVVENALSNSIEFRFEVEEGKKPLPPITFVQSAIGENKVESHLSMDMSASVSQEEVQRATLMMLREIEAVLESEPPATNKDFVLSIEADAELDHDKRIWSAVYLSIGAEKLALKSELMGYNANEIKEINDTIKALEKDVSQSQSVRAVLKKQN